MILGMQSWESLGMGIGMCMGTESGWAQDCSRLGTEPGIGAKAKLGAGHGAGLGAADGHGDVND